MNAPALATVYPRACGGTATRPYLTVSNSGLSPRLRGNLAAVPLPPAFVGSIPAPAGEPHSRRRIAKAGPVYPRACGGTSTFGKILSQATGLSPRCGGTLIMKVKNSYDAGLSPRLRGNRLGWRRDDLRAGSIPAPAGEPVAVAATNWGGLGLSPRLRGNPGLTLPRAIRTRSIPAPAGEPLLARPAVTAIRVYPRACGGTAGEIELL